jgi:preprotein translocase subunit SecY
MAKSAGAQSVRNPLLSILLIPELRAKIRITLIFLLVYRIGYVIPLPIINQEKMAELMSASSGGVLGQFFGVVSMFSGGNLSQSCIFALGIMPYISASIILQLFASSGLSPYLEKLRKEPNGQRKINEYTRYLTVPICFVQAALWVSNFMSTDASAVAPGYASGGNFYFFWFASTITLVVGTLFLMWIGEQIDEFGIGNGISLIIMAGIVARIPDAIGILFFDPTTGSIKDSVFTLGSGSGDTSFEKVLLLAFLFVAVIVGVIAITKAQRRIPMQSAKHVKGRRVFGGTRQFLPLKVNQAGVMPVIFASSLLIVPQFLFMALAGTFPWARVLSENFQRNSGFIYNIAYVALIYFFCYFWTAITMNPKEVANNLKDHGSFIPGYRPGKQTATYIDKVMARITYVGAAFLAIMAIIPTLMTSELEIDPRVAGFFGGTGLLIVVSVCLDLVQKINSHLVMRNYPSLTDD